MATVVTIGGVLSILVKYVVEDTLPQPSVAVTVIIALQSPIVLTPNVIGPGQSSVDVVAARAADSAAACVR